MTTNESASPEILATEPRLSIQERLARRGDDLAKMALDRYHATVQFSAQQRSVNLGEQVSRLISGMFEGYAFEVPKGATSLTVGGLTFMLCGTQTCLVGVCPDCGSIVVSDHVFDLNHLGQLIQNFVPHANHRKLIHGENP